MNSIQIVIERDSVCMADDIEAPHERTIEVSPDVSLRSLIAQATSGSYLASVAGGATWIVEGEQPLAVVAQGRPSPQFLVPPDTRAFSLLNPSGKPHLRFVYWCQVAPHRVFECLKNGQPLPDRYGR